MAFVAVVVALGAGCSDDKSDSDGATGDTAAVPSPTYTSTQQDAVREAATDFAAALTDLQEQGSATLSNGTDLAEFYGSFADATREAADRYEALDLPPEIATARDRLLALLDEQATTLDEIAAGAVSGEDESLTPQLERLTEVLGDVSTTNAELLRAMGVDAPALGA